ncbi:endonuclease [Clostridia bacterium]|nr:endonuclease [Clostridia bacterium]GHV07041.1 endonuclease [Clostridia bacterium]
MAATKIKPIKSTLTKALAYIQNPKKTDNKTLVSSFGCSFETADIEFEFTLSQARDGGRNVAHHLIQAFEPGETSPEQAHEIGKRLADEILQGKYEYVLTTHIDKGHIHNHLIFCAASFTDYRKYISNKRSYYAIRNASDRLCKEFGLSVITPGESKGKSYAEYAADKAGGSFKSKLKFVINTTIPQSKDFEEFLKRMTAAGYEVKRGKYISFRAVGQERFTRCKTLGEDYTEDSISKRIAGTYIRNSAPKHDSKTVGLIIDIENSIKAQQSAGYSRWQKIQNLKQAAKTVNFLTENDILQYADLQAKITDLETANDSAAAALKAVEKRLTDLSLLTKRVTTYRQTKPVYDGYKLAKDKGAYRREHEDAFILHEAAAKAIQAAGITTIPSAARLCEDFARLSAEKDTLAAEYGKLKQQAREYSIIKKNIDSILQPNTVRGKGKDRGAEL